MEMRGIYIIGIVLMLMGIGTAAALAQSPPTVIPGDTDAALCKQQLMAVHAGMDEAARKAAFMLESLEIQKATLIEWLKAAQAEKSK